MTRNRAKTLCKALESKFGGHAEFEAVNNKGNYRFGITTDRFEKVGHLKRQDLVWSFIDETLTPEETLDVSLILAYAPDRPMESEPEPRRKRKRQTAA